MVSHPSPFQFSSPAFNFLVVPAPFLQFSQTWCLRVGRLSQLSPNANPSLADSPSD